MEPKCTCRKKNFTSVPGKTPVFSKPGLFLSSLKNFLLSKWGQAQGLPLNMLLLGQFLQGVSTACYADAMSYRLSAWMTHTAVLCQNDASCDQIKSTQIKYGFLERIYNVSNAIE